MHTHAHTSRNSPSGACIIIALKAKKKKKLAIEKQRRIKHTHKRRIGNERTDGSKITSDKKKYIHAALYE